METLFAINPCASKSSFVTISSTCLSSRFLKSLPRSFLASLTVITSCPLAASLAASCLCLDLFISRYYGASREKAGGGCLCYLYTLDNTIIIFSKFILINNCWRMQVAIEFTCGIVVENVFHRTTPQNILSMYTEG